VQTTGIDTSGINAMLTQLRALSARAEAATSATQSEAPRGTPSFTEVLKASLDSLNAGQQRAQELGQAFAVGEDKVHLSDAMIAMQKASITFHAAVQVRNKLVSAYHEIMSMQV